MYVARNQLINGHFTPAATQIKSSVLEEVRRTRKALMKIYLFGKSAIKEIYCFWTKHCMSIGDAEPFRDYLQESSLKLRSNRLLKVEKRSINDILQSG